MDIQELRKLEPEEVLGKVHELKQELFHLRCQLALGRIENPMRIRHVRRDVARARTVLREKK
ncbi:50S ribosomal protein L29 [Candidatus Nitronereus thalassa]|uniref:Large ribosomal subunit protein uL29 n=1 Tax=Candidatus Nitronereus thalassa TaxID=3020898 RepID=A0ABU3KBN3_9BACT|nr:50S ribosomal protein L29 [Candidatus Nitronereus thalassa]MDT7043849.1 50S ribosomal protein L29 [Candidatus Nitronereus thalassa]